MFFIGSLVCSEKLFILNSKKFLIQTVKKQGGALKMHNIEKISAAVEAVGAVTEKVPNWFVVVMGIGTVFVGLICIIILCKIVALFCKEKKSKIETETAPMQNSTPEVKVEQPIENRQEIIAAVAAVCAEELGTDVSALRIHSFRKI